LDRGDKTNENPAVSNSPAQASHYTGEVRFSTYRTQRGELKMRLVDNLRKAEEKSVMTIRRGVERAREEWADVERRIRQRMRIYPQKQRAMAAAASSGQFNLEHDVHDNPQNSSGERRPIVSVHGHDLNDAS
jgi:hypothetical protein